MARAVGPHRILAGEYHLRSAKPNKTLHERVRHVLNALCEGNGVIEAEDHDFEIWLDSLPIFVRTYESPPAVTVYRGIAPSLAQTLESTEA